MNGTLPAAVKVKEGARHGGFVSLLTRVVTSFSVRGLRGVLLIITDGQGQIRSCIVLCGTEVW